MASPFDQRPAAPAPIAPFPDTELEQPFPVPTVGLAILRGLRGQCPRCRRAKLFRAFLKPQDHCPACGQDWTHHRADDFPAYLVILLTGHLLAPLIIAVELAYELPMGVQMLLWPCLAATFMLSLIQPAKGAVIAVQWRLGMHGFTRPDRKAADALAQTESSEQQA